MLTCNTEEKGEGKGRAAEMLTYIFHNAINVTKTTFLSRGLNYYQIKLDDTNYSMMGVLLQCLPTDQKKSFSVFIKMASF